VQVLKTDPPKVIGAATNNSNYVVHSADVVCELETRRGARLGAVTAHLSEIEPHQTKKFEVPIAQNTAYMAVVWEIRIQ
jgi:hypothetical protein